MKQNKKNPANTIRKKLMHGMLLILTLCVLIFSSFLVITTVINRQTSAISEKIAVLNWMSAAVDHSSSALWDYALTGDLAHFKEYDQTISQFNSKLEELDHFAFAPETAQRIVSLSNLYTAYVNAYISFYSNYSSMYKYYSTDYYTYYEQGEEIGGYIQKTLEEIREIEFQNSTETYSAIINNMQRFIILLLIFVLLVILVVIVISCSFTRDISEPLARLAENADAISRGELETAPETASGLHEIQVLSTAFASMISSIKSLLEKTREHAELEIMYREIRYRALLAQVNPHFLFNVLTCVSQSALADGAEEAVEMISYISTFLRYSLNNLRHAVTLADELRNVEAYVYLQKMRMGSSLSLTLQVCGGVDAGVVEVPWMILQPIVENCILHGFAALPYTGVVEITVVPEGRTLCITIRDNGCGISPEQLDALGKDAVPVGPGKEDAQSGHASIGLENIRERLDAYYQGAATLTIESAPGTGTAVTIHVPAKTFEELL